jgi:hypothetical protein
VLDPRAPCGPQHGGRLGSHRPSPLRAPRGCDWGWERHWDGLSRATAGIKGQPPGCGLRSGPVSPPCLCAQDRPLDDDVESLLTGHERRRKERSFPARVASLLVSAVRSPDTTAAAPSHPTVAATRGKKRRIESARALPSAFDIVPMVSRLVLDPPPGSSCSCCSLSLLSSPFFLSFLSLSLLSLRSACQRRAGSRLRPSRASRRSPHPAHTVQCCRLLASGLGALRTVLSIVLTVAFKLY